MKKSIAHSCFFLIFYFLGMSCCAHETLDVETLPSRRTKQYSMEPYRKIVIFSAPRTGSSLVYNMFRFLFENEQNFSCHHNEFNRACSVRKTHKYSDVDLLGGGNVLYVVPIRNPIDASVSTCRVRPRSIENIQDFCRQLLDRQEKHLLYAEKIKNEGGNVIIIKYEDFENNLDFLINCIENNFSMTISPFDKDVMKNGYNKENIYSCIKALPDFQEYLPISGFHGKHVSLETYTPPDIILYWLNYYLQDVKSTYDKYGYFSD